MVQAISFVSAESVCLVAVDSRAHSPDLPRSSSQNTDVAHFHHGFAEVRREAAGVLGCNAHDPAAEGVGDEGSVRWEQAPAALHGLEVLVVECGVGGIHLPDEGQRLVRGAQRSEQVGEGGIQRWIRGSGHPVEVVETRNDHSAVSLSDGVPACSDDKALV